MIGAASFWTGAAVTGNATESNVAGSLLPSLPESVVLGSLFANHKGGFRSGGLVGYSTFFTGYDPGRMGGGFRAISAGRLAGQGVTGLSHALLKTGVFKGGAETFLKKLTLTSRYGIGSALTAVEGVIQEGVVGLGSSLPDGRYSRGGLDKLFAAGTTRGGAYGWLTQIMGGVGDKSSFIQADGADKLIVRAADSASKGKQWATTGGKWAGGAARLTSAVLVAGWVAGAAADAVGSAYGSLVRTNMRLREQVGSTQSMSPGYFNQAAVTERQRAVMELNSSMLNPRTQLMGNEASFSHR